MFLVGCAGFALFAVNDLNDMLVHWRPLSLAFPLGTSLLIFSMALLCRGHAAECPFALLMLMWVVFAVFLLLELYTLFFAIPAKASYSLPGRRRAVHTGGVYALCRHPGVLWFAGMSFSLCVTAGLPLYAAAVFTALDILLVAFEDIFVFPRVLDGYADYKRQTPFLFPSVRSVSVFCGSGPQAAVKDAARCPAQPKRRTP